MFEFKEIMNNRDKFQDRVFPIVSADADIYKELIGEIRKTLERLRSRNLKWI